MGIPIGQKTVNLELRYSSVEVTKNLSTGEINVTIPYQIGFFDDSGKWVVESADVISASGDAALVLFGVKPADIGGTDQTPMGELINTLAYAVVSKQIPLTATLTIQSVTSSDATVPAPTSVNVVIKKSATGEVLSTLPLDVGVPSNPIPVVIGADIEISAAGFDPTVIQASLLQGDFSISSVTLTPTPQQTPTSGSAPDTSGTLDPTV